MCKHVAATLYGIGARLDENPLLFFTLREIDVERLISEVVTTRTSELIEKSREKTSRVLDDSEISGVFGIDVDDSLGNQPVPDSSPLIRKRPSNRPARGKRRTKKATAKHTTPGSKENRVDNSVRGKSLQERILEIIAEKGTGSVKEVAAALRSKKGFVPKTSNLEHQIRILLYKNPKGLLRKVGPGVFALAKREGSKTDMGIHAIKKKEAPRGGRARNGFEKRGTPSESS
jgi:hypothetical protein